MKALHIVILFALSLSICDHTIAAKKSRKSCHQLREQLTKIDDKLRRPNTGERADALKRKRRRIKDQWRKRGCKYF